MRQFTVAGIVSFSGADLGGSTIAAFDLPTAQQLFDKENKLDIVRVAGKAGVPQAKLAAEIKPLLPPTARVRTAEQQQKSDSSGLGFVDFIKYFLLAFAGIALFVGSFVIANTLSITIAQRVRELATLRTIGATRRQVRRSVLVEALVIGLVGSIVGLALGFALAKLLDALIRTIGIDLPQAGLVFSTRTVIVSLLVGVVITLIASLRPAMRATRVPPIAAVREGSVLPPSRLARFGPITAVVVLVLAILLLLYGVFAHNVATAPRLLSLGLGVLLLFFGASLNAPRLVRPLAKVLGWPGTKVGGPAGELAQRNATRNPSRTASTAAALMIGLALVTFVAILGQGLHASFDDAVNKLFVADYALTAPDNFAPFSVSADEAVGGTPGVTAVTPIRQGDARVFGKSALVTAVPPNLQRTVAADWYRGGPNVAAKLGRDGAFVEKKYAEKHHLSLGSPIALTTPTGKVLHLRLKGIFKAPKGGSPFGDVNFSIRTFDANYAKPQNLMTLINIKGGVNDANTARLKLATTSYPEVKVQTRDQFKKGQAAFINKLLNLLYALLGLSVIVSLFGIVNTLVLTVFERTRELGMLRAVGMTRRQVRQMIRHESIVTALIGATLGLVLGVFLAVLVTQALSSQGIVFAVPVELGRPLRPGGAPRRDPGGGRPRAPRLAAERAEGAPVRVAVPARRAGRSLAAGRDRPARGVGCGVFVRLRMLTEAECYARCYGAPNETVRVVRVERRNEASRASRARRCGASSSSASRAASPPPRKSPRYRSSSAGVEPTRRSLTFQKVVPTGSQGVVRTRWTRPALTRTR